MTRDRRRIVWIIEDCLASESPLKRVWTAGPHLGFSTRKEAMDHIKNWMHDPYLNPGGERYCYRASMYWPVV